ncbi:MAG: carboxypeptidase regulatory-like domain-containing protein, partial [Bryobacteraceae bacterium]
SLATSLSAQVSTADLVGTVTDPTGAAVANAKVTLTNSQTGASREVESDATGGYILTLLPPAAYNVSVEAAGFRKLVQTGLLLEINQRARVDFALQVGQVSETVEVTAAAALLESQSSSIGRVIPGNFISQLPLNGRNFVSLATQVPGVNGTGFSTAGTIMGGTRPDDRRPGSEIFSNGNREGANNFLYDGIDNNERLTISIVLRPPVEAVREFKVQTNLYSADLGRNSGAVVDVVTKSGSNEIHGSVFEFLRNSAMDARNFFNVKGTTFPPFRYNQYGFTFGGPVVLPKYNGKNKTFFFVDYEGFRRNSLSSADRTIPTLAIKRGDFAAENRIFDPLTNRTAAGATTRDQFPDNRIPQSRWDPVTAKLMAAYPDPINSARTNNYLANLQQTQNWHQGDVRIDHQLSTKDNFFARWSIQNTETIVPSTFPAVSIPGISQPVGLSNEDAFAGPSFSPTQHAVASWVRILSPRLVNELRVGFNRFRMDYTAEGTTDGGTLGNQLGVRNSNSHPLQSALPIFSPANYTGNGHTRSLPIFRRENTFQEIDNVTYTAGAHTHKFGGDVRRRQITEYQTNRGNGRFNFSPSITNLPTSAGNTGNSMASFLLGYTSLTEQDFTLAWVGIRGIETGLYYADDWRVNKRLTLNLGLRWEYQSPYTEVANRWASFDPATATVLVAGRDGVDSRAGVKRYFGGWSPRFGFAYMVNQKTVVRGGYGLFSNPNGHGGALLRLQRHLPFGPIFNFTSNNIDVGPRVSDG